MQLRKSQRILTNIIWNQHVECFSLLKHACGSMYLGVFERNCSTNASDVWKSFPHFAQSFADTHFYEKICKKLRKNEAACLCASRYLHNCRGLAKYTTLTGGLKFRFLISFCLNKSLVFSEKHGLTFELWWQFSSGRSGGGGGKIGGLILLVDLTWPSVTSDEPPGHSMIP